MTDDIEIIDIDKNDGGEEIKLPARKYSLYLKEGLLRSLRGLFWFFYLFAFEETVFHIWAFDKFTSYFCVNLLFCLVTASVLSLFVSFFPRTVNKILTWIFSVIILIYYIVHILYHSVFKVFLSIEYVDKSNFKIVQYYREIIQGIKDNYLVLIIAFFVPLIVFITLNVVKIFKYNSVSLRVVYIPLLYICLPVCISIFTIPLFGKEEFGAYDLLVNENVSEYSFDVLGALATNEVQIYNLVFPKEEVVEEDFEVWVYEPEIVVSSNDTAEKIADTSDNDETIIEETVKEIDRSPNILDIDFVSLAESEENSEVASIHKYMSSLVPTNRNEYTGLFEGYNLIFLTAEGFCNLAVDEKYTPTLYKLTHEGFVFNNFYNPRTGGSTSDGEFVNSTSLHPTFGGAKNFKIVGQKTMPFALGNMFNGKYGITSRAYHDNDYTYYGRDISYPAMGYHYEGVGNGVDVSAHWPQSDLEMMQDTIPDYIDDDLFHVYYMTVSGHLNYSFQGNWCASKHREDVADLPYSNACKAYIACQMEFDQAMKYLIDELDKKGILDRTVICFTGDHWPYGLTNEQFSELLGHEVETNFELYKSNLVLWTSSMEEPVYIDKQCCSMDIVPTLLNLFGFEYDSRLLMGQDILSDSEGFVGFLNKSVITDRFMYNASTKEVTPLVNEEITDEEVLAARKVLSNKLKYSSLIMSTDYYKYICDVCGISIPQVEQNYVPDYSKFVP